MINKRFMVELSALVAAAVLCALVANFFAAKERSLKLVADYPDPLTVPARSDGATPIDPVIAEAAPVEALDEAGLLASFAPDPTTPAAEVSGEQVWQIYNSRVTGFDGSEQRPVFLDARRSSVFAEGHIAGARSFSVWEGDIDDKVMDLAGKIMSGELNGDWPVVIYCNGGDCTDSHHLAEKIHQMGFNNALVYKDGFPDWQKRNLPTAP